MGNTTFGFCQVHLAFGYTVPAREKALIALSKRGTYELAEKLRIPYPYTIYPQGQRDTVEIASKLIYPL